MRNAFFPKTKQNKTKNDPKIQITAQTATKIMLTLAQRWDKVGPTYIADWVVSREFLLIFMSSITYKIDHPTL